MRKLAQTDDDAASAIHPAIFEADVPREQREVVHLPNGFTISCRKAFWIILLFASVLSMLVVYKHYRDTRLVEDSLDYQRLAVSLVRNHSYDSTYRPPAYPAFVGLIYAVAGPHPSGVYLVQALLLVVTLSFIFQVARHITARTQTALLVMGLCALWPPFYQCVPELMTEGFASFVLAGAVWLLLRVIEKPTTASCVAAGALLAICVLIKSACLPFVPIASLLVFMLRRRSGNNVVPALLVLLIAVVSLAPWIIRNYRVTGHVVPVSTGGGFNFWLGNWPDYYQRPWVWRQFPHPLDRMLSGKSEAEQDQILMKQALSYMKEDPLRAAGMFLVKFSAMWLGGVGTNIHVIRGRVPHIGDYAIPKMSVLEVPLFALAVIGLLRLPLEERRRALPIAVFLVVFTASYVLVTVVRRYAVPVEYYKLMFAGLGIRYFAARYHRHKKSER